MAHDQHFAHVMPDDINPHRAIPTDASLERRSLSARVPIGRVSTLRIHGDTPLDVLVEDLSAGGFRFSGQASVAPGMYVRIGLAGGGVSDAQIVRVGDGVYGCAFLETLSDSQRCNAFAADPVVYARFPDVPVLPPQTVEGRWRAGRLIAILLTSVTCWAVMAALIELR